MQLLSTFNKGIGFLLCIIDIFSKYTWGIPLEDKEGITITNAFQKILDESNRKPNKRWRDKGSEFYNRSMKLRLEQNAIEMYSTHNEGKYVVVERFIRTLKNKVCKYMASISKNMYIDNLDDIVNKYNNTYQNAVKMKPADVKSNTYINSSKVKILIKILNLKLVVLLKYQNKIIFFKGYVPNWSEEVFVIKKVKKKTVAWTYAIIYLNGEEGVRTFYEK